MSIRDQYNQNGYVIIQGCVDPKPVEEVLRQMYRLVLQQLHLHGVPYGKDVGADVRALFMHDPSLYISTLAQCAKLAQLHQLFLHENIRAIAGHLGAFFQTIPTWPVMNVMSNAIKIPDGYHGTAAHQDWPSLQGSIDMVTVWLPFTGVTKGNFPLEVIPGSHLNGLAPDGKLNGTVMAIDCDESKFVQLEASPGDVIFLSGFTVHRTGAGTDALRVAASMRFDNASEAEYIKRGYPCAQSRTADRKIITPDFPNLEQVRKLFGSWQ